jgi:hypothetical protein
MFVCYRGCEAVTQLIDNKFQYPIDLLDPKTGPVWFSAPVNIFNCDVLFVRYGGRHTVTMIPGDGIGPEMMNYVKQVFTSAGVPVDFEMINFDPTSQDYEDLRQVR